MRLGIVGSESAKFTPETEQQARDTIKNWIDMYHTTLVVSGGCHLGGIDIWAVEEAKKQNIPFKEHLPKARHWDSYKVRNIKIAEDSDIVICITVKTLPPGYRVKGFEKYCYHCKTNEHIKSGGCWTVKYARKIGRIGHIVVVGL